MKPTTLNYTPTMLLDDQQPIKETLRLARSKKTFLRFTAAEGIAWMLIHIVWSAMAVLCIHSVNNLTGNTVLQLLLPVSFFIGLLAFTIYPFWQFFFVRWKNKEATATVSFQFLSGIFYAVVVTMAGRLMPAWASFESLETGNPATYFATSLMIYYLHSLIFTAYNFWKQVQACRAEETKLRQDAYRHELDALNAQIEPHFLFNTLNSINATIPPNMEKTRVLIAQLADTFHYALQASKKRLVPLADEIEFITSWLALEKQRFGNRLLINYRVDANALYATIPPLLLQPLVENALVHGISKKVEGGTITIECRVQEDEMVYIAVTDDGVGCSDDLRHILSKGIGLSNTAKRLKLIYNQSLNLQRQHEGLTFSFSVPLEPVKTTWCTCDQHDYSGGNAFSVD